MQNFPFEHEGKTLWFSRSLACAVLCYAFDYNGDLHVLVNQRGLLNEVFPGMWNVPGGFIDFNENAKTCAIREVYEETGVSLISEDVEFFDLNTEPGTGRQTMVARFCCLFPSVVGHISITKEHCEPNEVAQVKWIRCDKETLMNFNWTRDQFEYILKGAAWVKKKHFFKYIWYKINAKLNSPF